MSSSRVVRNNKTTCYIGQLHENCNEELLFELFSQVGRVEEVYIPRDHVSNTPQPFGFVQFETEIEAEYASKVLHGTKLFEQELVVRRSRETGADRSMFSVGAKLFVGHLDSSISDGILADVFGKFGRMLGPPALMRNEDGTPKGFAFVEYDSFEAADRAIANMHGQYLGGQGISVEFAFKQGSRTERHGDEAERTLAAAKVAQREEHSKPKILGSGVAATH